MKSLKFGAFFVGLLFVVGTLVAAVSAQTARVQVEPRERGMFVLDGRGSQLGVMVSDVDAKSAPGAKIDEVNEESPAQKAGLKAGDIIVEYDGERVRSARQFTRLVQETPEGRSVTLALMRDGKRQTVTATPESGRMTWNFREPGAGNRQPELHGFAMPEMRDFNFRFPTPGSRFLERGRLGVTVQPLTHDLEEYFGATNGGALVSSVAEDSAASKAGLKAGDVIVSINGKSVHDADDLLRALDDVNGEASIVVMRDKKEMTLKATLERRSTTPKAGSRPGVIQ